MKLLLLTAEPVSADMVREAVGDDAEDAEVMVVSPALTDSPLRFWTSDADEAIEHARETADETVERLDEAGIDAAGDTGESDPLQALEDALQTFPADRIVVVTHPEGERDYLEDGFVEEAERRFGVPVAHREVTRG
jgi:nucleotide-binding universal stress UspA family protein